MPPRALLVVALLAVATLVGLWWRSRNGRYSAVPPDVVRAAEAYDEGAADAHDEGRDDRLRPAELGIALGSVATFVQLSSEVCAPCRRTHAVLAELAAHEPGVSHVELDVAQHLDLVRRFHVMRTPTVLVLDPSGVVVGRMSGATDRRHAHHALERLAQETTR
ncbi:thioredoxin family protein [Cellulomonas composti]|uniref:Thioredoxin domain-containing protein n=1 Tax=Cellulomonas composti TaxID=266130 RepID=A0A511J7E5_9CELL|nr:thioredoxin family protein [Cellulomonas composti]GEL93932.1 hypothetical protein CCO02nite_05900 [Cellulomonas composti]